MHDETSNRFATTNPRATSGLELLDSPEAKPTGVIHEHTNRRTDELRSRLAAIVESSDDAIVSKTLEGIIQSWNAGASRLFGWSDEEAVGRSITIIIPPERLDEEKDILSRLRRGERIDHFETERMAKDGRRIDISLTVSPVRDSHGVIVGASKVARDVTERKRTERMLRAAEHRFRAVFNQQFQFMVLLNVQGTVLEANDTCFRITGTSRHEVVGRAFPDLAWWAKRPDVQEWWRSAIAKAAQTGLPVSGDIEFDTAAGSARHASVVVTGLRDDSDAVGTLIVELQDDTERRQADLALREADRRKDEFLATLAHELRNPLAPIRNTLQIYRTPNLDPDSFERSREMMERQVQHLVRLVDDTKKARKAFFGVFTPRTE